jgi:hypothetical protein
MMPAGIRPPRKDTAQQTKYGLHNAPGPSPLARLVLDTNTAEKKKLCISLARELVRVKTLRPIRDICGDTPAK